MDVLQRIAVDAASAIPLAEQVREQFMWLIANEVLRPGDRLPSLREAAHSLRINVNTVRSAYLKLQADELIAIRQGEVARVLPLNVTRLIRSASTIRTETIGVIVPSLDSPFYHALHQGINDIAFPNVLQFVCSVGENVRLIPRVFAQFLRKGVDGIIVASFNAPSLLQAVDGKTHVPLVTVDWPGAVGYSVKMDYESAGYLSTRHLIEHGHRRIGLIRFFMDVPNVSALCDGWARALHEAGIPPDPTLISRVPGFDMAAGSIGMRELLTRPDWPTAVFASADMLALGVMRELRTAGLRVPQDIALASFNDVPIAALVDPPLTTTTAPALEMGRAAMQMLNAQIAGHPPAQSEMVFPTALVVRQSCGCYAHT